MKTVFTNSMVAHLWANRSQAHARSHNGNFWFEGDTIYSYDTPIARHMRGADGQTYILRTSETFSVTTTSKHESSISYALSADQQARVFYVPSIVCRYESDDVLHALNVEYLGHQFREACERSRNFRVCYWGAYDRPEGAVRTYMQGERRGGPKLARVRMLDLTQAWENLDRYRVTFGMAPADTTSLKRAYKAFGQAWRKFHDPAAVRRREKARAKATERRMKEHAAELRSRMFRSWGEAICATLYRPRAIEIWREGGRLPYTYAHRFNDPAMLRLSPDGTRIETSQGAVVPSSVAKSLWTAAKGCRKLQHDYVPTEPFRVGPFHLSKIDNQGNITVGCHYIEYDEMARLAPQLGLAVPTDATH